MATPDPGVSAEHRSRADLGSVRQRPDQRRHGRRRRGCHRLPTGLGGTPGRPLARNRPDHRRPRRLGGTQRPPDAGPQAVRPGVAAVLLVSVVVVNVVTIAADLQAGAAGIGLLAGVDSRWLVVPLGLALVGLLLVGKYDEVVACCVTCSGLSRFRGRRRPGPSRLVHLPQVQPGSRAVAASRRGGGWPRAARHHVDQLRLCVGDHRAGGRRTARRHHRGPGTGPGEDRRRHRCRVHGGHLVVHARRLGGHPGPTSPAGHLGTGGGCRRYVRSPGRWPRTCSPSGSSSPRWSPCPC